MASAAELVAITDWRRDKRNLLELTFDFFMR